MFAFYLAIPEQHKHILHSLRHFDTFLPLKRAFFFFSLALPLFPECKRKFCTFKIFQRAMHTMSKAYLFAQNYFTSDKQ